MLKYGLFFYLLTFNLQASDDESSKNLKKHLDPFAGCPSVATKSPRIIVKIEPIGQKLVKITYNDGSTKTL